MTFADLYGIELDRELGSSSTSLFTTARRKAAINAAQQEWVTRTECLTRQAMLLLSDATQEYDLEAINVTSGALALTVVASTGTFTRGSGSFLTDGFVVGQTITPSGFDDTGNSLQRVISAVTALVITVESTTSLANETGDGDELIVVQLADFGWISKQGVSIKITDSDDNVRYIEGDDLIETSVERLNVEERSWRAVSASTPKKYYLRRADGAVRLGFHPAPDIASGDTWEAIVSYVPVPADLSADTDEPFTLLGHPVKSLRPWHRALAHYAAHDLEKLRKETARSGLQLQMFEALVEQYTGVQKPKRGSRVRFQTPYRRTHQLMGSRVDPRTWP